MKNNPLKKILSIVILSAIVLSTFVVLTPKTALAASAKYLAVHANSSVAVSNRTVNGTVFSETYNYSVGGNILTARRNGRTITLTYHSGGNVVSNGRIVYYTNRISNNFVIYKQDLDTGKNIKIKDVGTVQTGVFNLSGLYKNDLYYTRGLDYDGTFWKVNVKTKSAKKLSIKGHGVSGAAQYGQYFIMHDGTGAGLSYLGLWDAKKNKFTEITAKPKRWLVYKSISVYYVQILKQGAYNPQKGYSLDTIAVKRYNMATGSRRVLVKSMEVRSVKELTNSYIKYVDKSGKEKTRRW